MEQEELLNIVNMTIGAFVLARRVDAKRPGQFLWQWGRIQGHVGQDAIQVLFVRDQTHAVVRLTDLRVFELVFALLA